MPRVLVTRRLPSAVLAKLEEIGTVDLHESSQAMAAEALCERVRDKDALLCMFDEPIDRRLIDAGLRLKVIATVAVGYNNIDVKAATRRGVMVTNTPGVLDDTTADFTWCLMLATARRLVEGDKFFRTGKWQGWGLMQYLGHDVHHKTLGILGLGRIGKAVARRAKGFDMRVIYYDAARTDESTERELGVMYVDKRTLLRESDFVTLHVPLLPETNHYISHAEFALMKRTAILINASRGPVVDEKALVKALKERQIAGAGLDVYEKEPKVERALIGMKNVVLAPHIASSSVETRQKMAMIAVQNCIAGLTGQRPPNLLNPEVLGR